MTITAEQLVCREVYHTISHMVSTLAQGYGRSVIGHDAGAGLYDLTEQAFELANSIDDYEEAVIQAGWELIDNAWHLKGDGLFFDGTAQELAEEFDIEPYQREVYEHWIVSTWLAEKLEAKGEKVDHDFAGLTVWARTTTGQGIASDYVIEQIVKEMGQ